MIEELGQITCTEQKNLAVIRQDKVLIDCDTGQETEAYIAWDARKKCIGKARGLKPRILTWIFTALDIILDIYSH